MTDLCTACGQTVGKKAVETKMGSGRVTGRWHRRCYRERRYELSGSPQSRGTGYAQSSTP